MIELVAALAGSLGTWFWIRADVRYLRRSDLRVRELDRQGRWAELRLLADEDYRTPRLWVRVVRRNGVADLVYAHALNRLGYHEEALHHANLAFAQVGSRPQKRSALAARMGALYGLARHQEALATLTLLDAAGGGPVELRGPAMASALYAGRFDIALALADEAMARDAGAAGPRTFGAHALMFQGDFGAALRRLVYHWSRTGPYDPEFERRLPPPERLDPEYLARRDRDFRWIATVAGAVQKLTVARVLVEAGDPAGANVALAECAEAAADVSETRIAHAFLATRVAALSGDRDGTHMRVERMRLVVGDHPARSYRWEADCVAGIALAGPGATDEERREGIALLRQAARTALHPLEKHVANFHLARAHVARGDQMAAQAVWRMLLDDGLQSHMRAEAERELAATAESAPASNPTAPPADNPVQEPPAAGDPANPEHVAISDSTSDDHGTTTGTAG